MLTKRFLSVAVAACTCLCSLTGRASPGVSKTEAEQRLNYLVGSPSFSKSKPLTQTALMELIIDLAFWGQFPKPYRHDNARRILPGCDEYITRSDARRFARELVGRDLSIWQPLRLTADSNPKIIGDKLGWWYNTSNTMHQRPKVLITREIRRTGRRATALFRIVHRIGNISDNPSPVQIGSGSAVLARIGGSWVVTSWRVQRNKRWDDE